MSVNLPKANIHTGVGCSVAELMDQAIPGRLPGKVILHGWIYSQFGAYSLFGPDRFLCLIDFVVGLEIHNLPFSLKR